MSQNRWNEPFSRTYIGFETEATVFTDKPMSDLDNQSPITSVTDAPLTNVATTINVASTAGFSTTGSIVIEQEVIAYTGVTLTSFTGATRGSNATTAASHVAATAVKQFKTSYFTNFYINERDKQYWTNTDAVVVKAGATLGAATVQAVGTYSLQRLGGIVRMNAPLAPGFSLWVSGKYTPMYRLLGARNVSNNAQRQEIDTTANGDNDMTGVPGRPKRGGSFTFIPGAVVTNAAGNSVTLKNMIETSAKGGNRITVVAQNDYSNVLLPRDVSFGFVGNTDMQRNLGQVIQMPVTWYQAACDDADSYNFIDYVA